LRKTPRENLEENPFTFGKSEQQQANLEETGERKKNTRKIYGSSRI
jgi:hypothetical protein